MLLLARLRAGQGSMEVFGSNPLLAEDEERAAMNFSAAELDLIVRGLFALEQIQPIEKPQIQELLNRFNSIRYDIQSQLP